MSRRAAAVLADDADYRDSTVRGAGTSGAAHRPAGDAPLEEKAPSSLKDLLVGPAFQG